MAGPNVSFLVADDPARYPRMKAIPHFLLKTESGRRHRCDWHIVLETADGHRHLEIDDDEPAVQGERLELLTVVRALESLDQPSQVTLLTPSNYVSRGLIYGLDEWRGNNWHWELHGRMV